jgi:hypothetical protein
MSSTRVRAAVQVAPNQTELRVRRLAGGEL